MSPATPPDSKPARSLKTGRQSDYAASMGLRDRLEPGPELPRTPPFPAGNMFPVARGRQAVRGSPSQSAFLFPLESNTRLPVCPSLCRSIQFTPRQFFRSCGMPGARMSNSGDRLPFVYFFRYSTLLRCSTRLRGVERQREPPSAGRYHLHHIHKPDQPGLSRRGRLSGTPWDGFPAAS